MRVDFGVGLARLRVAGQGDEVEARVARGEADDLLSRVARGAEDGDAGGGDLGGGGGGLGGGGLDGGGVGGKKNKSFFFISSLQSFSSEFFFVLYAAFLGRFRKQVNGEQPAAASGGSLAETSRRTGGDGRRSKRGRKENRSVEVEVESERAGVAP